MLIYYFWWYITYSDFWFFNKEIWIALEAASTKAKKIHYKKFHIYSKECKVTEQNSLFNKIKKIVEKISVTGLLLVRLACILKLIIDQ